MQPPVALTSTTQAQARLAYDGSVFSDLQTRADGVLAISAPVLAADVAGAGNQFAKAEVYWDDAVTTRAGVRFRGTPDEVGWHHAKVVGDRDPALFTYGSFLGFYIEGKNSGDDDDSVEEMRLIYARADEVKLILGGNITNGGALSFPFGPGGTYAGYKAGDANPQNSTYNTLFGYESGRELTGDGTTGGRWNTWGGFQTGKTATSAYGNSGHGMQVHQDLEDGFDNSAYGIHSQLHLVDGFGNSSLGGGSLQNGLSTTETVAVGMYAGRDFDGDRGIFIGSRAGMYETADDTLMIDNQDRGSEALARQKAMIYGVFNADPAQQKLVLNAGIFFTPFLPTSSAGLASGRWWNNAGVPNIVP